MCRNIRTLFNFEPPVTREETHAAAVQFVRKISGFTVPSKNNEAAFRAAVDAIEGASRTLLASLQTRAPVKSRADEGVKAQLRAAKRFLQPIKIE